LDHQTVLSVHSQQTSQKLYLLDEVAQDFVLTADAFWDNGQVYCHQSLEHTYKMLE